MSFLQALDTWDSTSSPNLNQAVQPNSRKRSAADDGLIVKGPPIPFLQQVLKASSPSADNNSLHSVNTTNDKETGKNEYDKPLSGGLSTSFAVPEVGSNTRNTHLLLVDDNDVNIRILAACAKKESCTFTKAYNGQEAVDLFKVNADSIDLIFMDITMPVMDGCTAAREIRKFEEQSKLSRTSIIAVTALSPDQVKQQACFDAFITKPVRIKEIREFLKAKSG